MEKNNEHKLPLGKDAGAKKEYTKEELTEICNGLANENMQLKGKCDQLSKMLDQARQMMDSLQTQNLFAYLSALNKVLDNAALFGEEFINETTSSIEDIMRRLHELFLSDGEPGDDENTQAE